MKGALFFDGWEGASATIFDCDGTYLPNVTLEDLNSNTVWLCLPGASDYGRLKVNVSSGESPREIYWELTSAESQNTEMTGGAPTSEQSFDACEMLTVQCCLSVSYTHLTLPTICSV